MKRKILSLILSVSLLATLFSVSIVTGAAGNVDYGSKAWENFETMTNEQAKEFFPDNKDLASYSIGVKDGVGEGDSKGLELDMGFYPGSAADNGWGWLNVQTGELPIKDAVGIRIWYTLNVDTASAATMRLTLKDRNAGAWTDIGFVGNAAGRDAIATGTYSKTILFKDFPSFNANNSYSLGVELGDVKDGGTVTLTLDNITFIYYGSVGVGDKTELNALLKTYKPIYDTNNQDKEGNKLYSDTSYANFKTAYETAVNLPEDATQTVIDAAVRSLTGYYKALEQLTLNYAVLETALNAADTFFADPKTAMTYTEHSIGLIQAVYDTTKAMYDNKSAKKQSEIDNQAVTMNTAVSKAYPIVKETPVYTKDKEDTLLVDFEDYDSFADIPLGGGDTDGWQFESEPFATRLDKTNPISGKKSLKITWDGLDDNTWGAYRLFMYNSGKYPMHNQAMTFTIKVAFDYDLTVAFYDMDTSTTYTYTTHIKASDKPQTVTVPFNQFKNNEKKSYGYGQPLTAEEFARFVNQWNCFKIQLDRISGLPEKGEMWLDCFKLTANEGPQEAAPPPDGQGGDSSDSSDSSGGESSGEIIEPDDPQPDESDGFHVLQNFEDMTAEKLAELFGTPSAGTLSLDTSKKLFGSNSMKLTYDFTGDSKSASIQAAFPGLRGDGLYLMVLSANDAVLTLKLSDGTLWTEYQVPVKGSDKEQMVFVNFVDTVSGKGTFDELNKAKITLSMTLSSEKAIAGDIYFDNIGYFLYDEMLENKTPDGGDSSNGGNSSNGGDSSNGGSTSSGGSDSSPSTGEAGGLLAVAGLGVLAAMAAIVVSRRKKTENISSDM